MNRSENKHLVLKAFEGPTWYHHVGFPCNQSQACGIAVVVAVLAPVVVIIAAFAFALARARTFARLSFSFRTDLITRVTDPTRGQWRQSRRRRRRATWAGSAAAAPPEVGWAGNRNILNFIHERTSVRVRAGSECGLG